MKLEIPRFDLRTPAPLALGSGAELFWLTEKYASSTRFFEASQKSPGANSGDPLLNPSF